jgi:hypothetical protein
MRLSSLLATALLMICGTAAYAQGQPPQQPIGPALPATTVQLPTFSFFTVQTTVSVPDGGGISLGGVDRGVDSTVNRSSGLTRNRGLGSSRTASGVRVSATIIDREEMDRAVLAEAAAKRGVPIDGSGLKAAALSKSTSRSDATAADSLAAIRERNAAKSEAKTSELTAYMAKAQQAEADGKPGIAKIYYQMVARGDQGQLKQQAEARLAALGAKQATSVAKR